MSRISWCFLQSFYYNFVHHLIGDSTRSTRPRRVIKSEHTMLDKTLTPLTSRSRTTPQLTGYIHIRHTISRSQHYLTPQHQILPRLTPTYHPLQLLTLTISKLHNHSLTTTPTSHNKTSKQ